MRRAVPSAWSGLTASTAPVLEFERCQHGYAGKFEGQRFTSLLGSFNNGEGARGAPVGLHEALGERAAHTSTANNDEVKSHPTTLVQL